MIWVVLLLLVHQCIATNNWVKDLNPIALSDVWSPVDQVKKIDCERLLG